MGVIVVFSNNLTEAIKGQGTCRCFFRRDEPNKGHSGAGYAFLITERKVTLEKLQALVGGHIETVPESRSDISIFCDEEGLINNKEPCLYQPTFYTASTGWLVRGNIVVCKRKGEDTLSMTEDEAAKAVRLFTSVARRDDVN